MANVLADDELLKGLDDSSGELSEAQMEERRAKFEKAVKKNIAILMSPKKFDAAKRAEAATWLGESGEPEAIQYLVKIYQRTNEDAKVKAAAARSLGLFKALGDALADPDLNQGTMDLLEGIVYHGRMSKPSRWQGGRLRRINSLLIISALVLFVVGTLFAAPAPAGEQTALAVSPTVDSVATPADLSPADSVSQFETAYLALDEQTRLLSAQVQLVARGQRGDCSQTLAPLDAFSADPDFVASDGRFAFFPQAYEGYLQVADVAQRAFDAFSAYCSAQTPFEASALAGELLNAQATLARLEPLLGAIGIVLPPTSTPIPLPTETVTPTLTPAPTATLDAVVLRQQVLAVEQILDLMAGQRGLNEILLVYWQDALSTGSDAGCRQYPAIPLFPAPAVIPANVQLQVPSELLAAAEAANLGLSLSQQSWAGFISACNSNTLQEVAPLQSQAAIEARRAFENAAALLDSVQSRLN